MSQRTIAGLLALPMVVALILCAFVLPLPYTIYWPGLTVNLLGSNDSGQPIITVGKGGPTLYRDSGGLRMVTVEVTTRDHSTSLFEMLRAWGSNDDAVYPRSYAYPDQGTSSSDHSAGAQEMTSAQDSAVVVALSALGYRMTKGPIVEQVQSGSPADGTLRVGDLIVSINGHKVASSTQVVSDTAATPSGTAVDVVVQRAGVKQEFRIVPKRVDGKTRIGVSIANGALPAFDVSVNIPSDITGPSAGLMMALSIYDELTPGSLTGGAVVAGTGTIDPTGAVGVIGGIQQKIPGAARDGAQLFLVPAGNCPDVAGADHGSMRLAKVGTFADALRVIQTWAKDHNAPLPSC